VENDSDAQVNRPRQRTYRPSRSPPMPPEKGDRVAILKLAPTDIKSSRTS
jgi:hypothetical protein